MSDKTPFNFKNFFGFSITDIGTSIRDHFSEGSGGGCSSSKPAAPSSCGGGCSCESKSPSPSPTASSSCGSGCGCESPTPEPLPVEEFGGAVMDKTMGRRSALKLLGGATTAAATMVACSDGKTRDTASLEFDEYFKKNYRMMTDEEKDASIDRLQKLTKKNHNKDVKIKGTPAQKGVLYGYAFNISKCQGYGECIEACVGENNQDRDTNMQYIRIFEMENGSLDFGNGHAEYNHPVPAEGHFYLGTQCMQCANPPCVEVCPVKATWQEPDGIVVIDYDWCIGCRYCEAACPYWARRFNWKEPEVPVEEINPDQHYLGNRMRKKGCMEKCTFCISRSRDGKNPACVEACPTGARVFGNLLDPDSEIRYVLKHKKVFRLKEDLGTEPKFWYYMD